ncbi:MAG: transglycosylase domain-containing protein, partial [Oscillibacter sp.]
MFYVKTTLTPTLKVNADDYTLNLSSMIYYQDKETEKWEQMQILRSAENRILVDYDQMPEALWQAAVAIEDQRFFTHHGVDWKRTIGATLKMFSSSKDTYGGSTLTQQLLKNMTGDNAGTVNRKVREIFRALEFEKNYAKPEILELYLNTIYLGETCYGVQTAAQYYFGKNVDQLSLAECASLIAITNNPSLYGPFSEVTITRKDGSKVTARELNKERQELILDKMADKKTGLCYITEEERDAAKAEVLQFTDGTADVAELVAAANGADTEIQSSINSYFVDQVFREVSADMAKTLGITEKDAQMKLYNGGYNIYTTIDPDIQSIAESVYTDRSNLNVTSRKGQNLQSGITIIDPATGNVVAMVGKVGEKKENLGWNYAAGRRQVGSSIKPLTVYAPALDAGVITMASTFDNYPVRLLNDVPWPKNSPQGYTGWTTLARGVAGSINTVAVQVVEKLGVKNSYAFATEQLNLGLVKADMDVSPLGLGGLTNGLSTLEMAAAYASFASEGVYHTPRMYVKVTDANGELVLDKPEESHAAMKATTAYFMNTLLQGVVSGGTGSSANFGGMTIAGKTGTTSDNYDRYFVGYTPYYCAAVWCGYDQPEKISYSGNPSITMWKKVMSQIHKDLPNKSFAKPSGGLVTVSVCSDSGLLATDACRADPRGDRTRDVSVAAGTAPTESCAMHTMVSWCTEGKCLAGPFCPAESVVQKALLDYVRADYGESIKADDNAYLLGNAQFASETVGCPTHASLPPETVPEEHPNSDLGDVPPGEEGNV